MALSANELPFFIKFLNPSFSYRFPCSVRRINMLGPQDHVPVQRRQQNYYAGNTKRRNSNLPFSIYYHGINRLTNSINRLIKKRREKADFLR